MKRLNILVFPCGSEIGLEVHRSMRYSTHVNLIGANSMDDHGKFVFENYLGGVPFIHDENFIPFMKKVVQDHNIDAIYPAMDQVIWVLKSHEEELGCKVIASNVVTTEICLSKKKTYRALKDVIQTPKIFASHTDVDAYPVFVKPNIGYGSRGVFKADTVEDLQYFFKDKNSRDFVIMEYLPNEEFTVDCFTNRHGELLFVGSRERKRISNGISVNTAPIVEREDEFHDIATRINKKLSLRGAWFFQVKKNIHGELILLEVAARLGGSSSLYRMKGVNFALLSVFDAFDINVTVDITANTYDIELDRALSSRFRTDLDYSTVYVDLDDCVIVNDTVNLLLITFLYQSVNMGKNIVLISKHNGSLQETVKKFRLTSLFDEVIHLNKNDEKYLHITDKKSIFIDDSFVERQKIVQYIGVPVFSPDMVECLIH